MESRVVSCPYNPNGIRVPSDVNFGTTLFESLQRYATSTALGNIHSGEKITYETLRLKAENVARHLIGHYNCREGDVIAAFAYNSLEWIVLALAAFRIGAVLAAFSSQLKVEELKVHLRLSGAKFLFTDDILARIAVEACKDVQPLNAIFINGESVTQCVSFKSLLLDDVTYSRIQLPQFDDLNRQRSRDKVALVLFSSGTTGSQKAVMLSHTNLQASLLAGRQERCKVLDERNISFLPFYTVYGLTTVLYTLCCGCTTYFMVKFDLEVYLRHVEQLKIAFLLLVPPVANMLVKTPFLEKFNLSAVTVIMSGGAPMTRATEDILFSRFPNVRMITQVYGMTEVTGAFCNADYEASKDILSGSQRKHGTVGVPMSNVRVKVIDIHSGDNLGPNEEGELCIQSPSVMLGYAGDAKATSEAIDPDGWLHTGDIGYFDKDGYIYIVDRLKELIKYNAYQVAPAELESVLLSHNDVADAAVVGLPDAKAGELPMAWIVRKPISTVSESQLQQYVADKVASYKQLRGGVRFTSAIPKTPSGKILRRELRKALLEGKL